MQVKQRHIVVAGLGKTGVALVRFLARRGAKVTVTDTKSAAELKGAIDELENISPGGFSLALGAHPQEIFASADAIVLSPGVPHDMPPIREAARKGVEVIGEIELAYRYMKTPIIAVTGTNGKSTTTLLVAQMLSEAGMKVFAGGNLGTPLIEYADNDMSADMAVVEVSSFQLDTIERFRPRVSVCLNVSADHLDRYDSFAAYVGSKARVFMNQAEDDIAVVNFADPALEKLSSQIPCRVLGFHAGEDHPYGASIDKDRIRFLLPGQAKFLLDVSSAPLIGAHNRENIAAAGLAAAAAGADFDSIQQAVTNFRGLPHRMQPVAEIDGVQYIDDSKATNVDAVVRALEGFSTPVVLIMGGREKGGSYAALKPVFKGRVKHLVVMGEAAETIAAELGAGVRTSRAASMNEAVEAAREFAAAGDTVLLSPACASFDMYESYAVRGEDFGYCVSAGKTSRR